MKFFILVPCFLQMVFAGSIAQAIVTQLPKKSVAAIASADTEMAKAILSSPYDEVAPFIENRDAIDALNLYHNRSTKETPSFGEILSDYQKGTNQVASTEAILICGVLATVGAMVIVVAKDGLRRAKEVRANRRSLGAAPNTTTCKSKAALNSLYDKLQRDTQATLNDFSLPPSVN